MADFSNDLNLALRIRALVEGQDAVVDLGTSFIDLNQRIENLIRGLTAISGSTEGAQREFEYLAGVAQKYGLKILELSDNYVKLIASSKGTALEGEAVKKVFESVSGAMSVLGGDTITTHRAFTALAQMMSKGQIYSEELKGQLAEAIPGALGIMSRALGITTDDLRNLMDAGSLSAEVLLPFATQLSKEYGNLATSGRTFTQSVNDLKNTWTLLMERLENGSGAFSAISASIEWLSKSSGVLAGVVGVGLSTAFLKLGSAVVSTTKSVSDAITTNNLYGNSLQRAAKADLDAANAAVRSAAARAAQSARAAEQALIASDRAALAVAANEREVASLVAKNATYDSVTRAINQQALAEEKLVAASAKTVAASEALAAAKTAEAGAINAGNAAAAQAFKQAIANEATAAANLKSVNLGILAQERRIVLLEAQAVAEAAASASGLASAETQQLQYEAGVKLDALKERQLAATERLSLANGKLVASTLALSGAGQAELVQAQQLAASRERAYLDAVRAESAAKSALLTSEQKVASLLAEGGSTQALATAQMELNIARRAGDVAAAGAIAAEEALTAAKLAEAEASLTASIAANNLAKSQTLLSKTWQFLIGPGGMIALMIAGFAAMAYAFREQDDATKSLTKSTEEYAESLKKMNSTSLLSSIRLHEIKRAATIDEIEDTKKLLANQQKTLEFSEKATKNSIFGSLIRSQNNNAVRETIEKLEKAEANLAETDAKIAAGRSAMIDKTTDIIASMERNRFAADALGEAIKSQREEIDKLKLKNEEGLAVDVKIDASYKNLARLRKEAAIANANLTESQNQYNAAFSDYANRQKELALYAGYTTGALDEQGLTTEQLSAKFKLLTQSQLAATNRVNQLKNAVIELTARQENFGTSMRAEIDLQDRLATATGNAEKQRAAAIAKARIEQELSVQGVAIAETALRALEEEIVQKKILLETNPKIEKQTSEQIAKLEAQVIAQKAQVAQRIANAKAAVAEAEAAKVAGEVLSKSLERQRSEAAQAQSELANLRQKYIDMAAAGDGMNELLRVMEMIRAKEKQIADQANNTEIATKAAFKSLGQSFEEVMTGMDFETRKAIDALKTLGKQGELTGDDLRKAMDKAIDLADTVDEIGALKTALYDLAKDGKISTDQYKQSIVALNVKLADMRAELDPTQRAMAALGLGVSEKLDSVSKSMKANSEIVRDNTKSLALGQDAFLKYAEAEIEAAKSGDRAVDAQVKARANTLGLSSAYEELVRNLARANPEFDAIAAKMDRIAETSEKRRESITGEIEADLEHIDTIERKNLILGEGVEMANTLIEQSDRSIALAKEQAESDRESALSLEKKIAALEAEQKSRGKLSAIQERELELLRLELPLKQQSAAISAERAKQIEQEAFSQSKVVEQINRVVEASIIEKSAATAVLRSRLETIESEIDLAKAKGDTSKAMDLQAEKSRVEKDILDLGIQAREDATAAARAYVDALVALAEQDGTITEIERQGIETARNKIEILEQEEIAYRENAEAIKAKSQAEIESVESANKAREAAERTRAAGQIVTDTLNGWIDNLKALSPAAVEAFEKMRGFTDSAVATETSSDGAKRSIDELGAAMVSLGDTGFVRFMNEAAVQALTVEASFYAQAQSADSLAQSLNDMADSGTGNMEEMIRSAESARVTMDLLDKTRLDALQSAIDRARGAMDSLRESSEAALEAAQRALAQQQGDQRALIELDRKQKIAELDKQLAAAQAANDQESINKLQQALDLEQQTYELKKKALAEDQAKQKATGGKDSASPPTASGGTSATTTINNTFLIDPTKLANEEWVKKNVMPTIEKVGRLRA